jgi:hypothetical protein
MVRRLVEISGSGLLNSVPVAPRACASRRRSAAGPRLGGVVSRPCRIEAAAGAEPRRFVEPGVDVGQPQSVVAGLGFGQRGAPTSAASTASDENRRRADPAHRARFSRSGWCCRRRPPSGPDQAQQGRFAGAVAADQADSSRRTWPRGAIEQHAFAVAEGEVVDVNMGPRRLARGKGQSNRLAGPKPRVYKAPTRQDTVCKRIHGRRTHFLDHQAGRDPPEPDRQINARFEEKGLRIVAQKRIWMTRSRPISSMACTGRVRSSTISALS